MKNADLGPVELIGAVKLRAQGVYQQRFKRAFDIVVSVVLLPVILPILFLCWLMVRLDGGPGLFKQQRIGRYGTHFSCFKLRTMHVDAEERLEVLCVDDEAIAAEWKTYQKLKDDPRVSKLGNFLRKTSLDELPQIFNVLRGDMSLVGPRPFLPDQETLYRNAGGIHYYALRPGVTGLWQIEGRNSTKFVDRVRYDNLYAAKVSLSTDIGLVLRTVTVVVGRTGQ